MNVRRDVDSLGTSKGIYTINNIKNIKVIRTSDDLDKSKEDFFNGTLLNGYVGNYVKKFKDASFEILKVTDTPEIDIWEYLLPQISRVTYEENLYKALSEGFVKKSHVKKAIDWFCETYVGSDYSVKVDYNPEKYITLTIFKNIDFLETYCFKGGKAIIE